MPTAPIKEAGGPVFGSRSEGKQVANITTTMRLGDILIEAGVLTPDKLELALKEQRQTGEHLGAALQRLGICSERTIAHALAEQIGVPCVELGQIDYDPEAMKLLPKEFCMSKSVLAVERDSQTLKVVMASPTDIELIDEMGRMTGLYIEVLHAAESELNNAITTKLGVCEEVGDDSELVAEARAALASGVRLDQENSPFVRLVDHIIERGVIMGATDIHIEPEERVLRCRYRVDGRLSQGETLPLELQAIVITRVKIMAEMNISENRVPQDGRIVFKSARKKVDLRVSTMPTVHGEGIVCRILDKENLMLGLPSLGMAESMLGNFKKDIEKPHGIILVTGPTGSGKTTTLYAALAHLNHPDTKIITLEDPVEYELPVINQAQINTAKGFTFAKGLRAILRQDPDIILVGEIRDQETAQLAIRAALTGHLVFSTLHTNSASGAIPRLLDMGVEPFLLSATLVSVVAQRLVRRVCAECNRPYVPTDEDLAYLGASREDLAGGELRLGAGCPVCHDTGYRGREAVFEYLQVDERTRRMVAEGRDALEIEKAARGEGQASLRENALEKLKSGRTSIDEVVRVTV